MNTLPNTSTTNSASQPAPKPGALQPALQLSTHNLTVGYGDAPIIEDLSHTFTVGKVTSIIGPNGCGKSTLLRTLARLLKASSGSVQLGEKALTSYSSKILAQKMGVLPQSPTAPDGISVADLVGRGRTPHHGIFGRWNDRDYAKVAEAMTATGIADLAERSVDELSGGQRQRVWIAMALAQDTDILLLDEPTTYLDLKHQLEILDLLTELNNARGTTIIMVLHDLNLAARYSDELVAMRSGQIIASGAPADVITEKTLHDVFNLDAQVIDDPVSGLPAVMPIGRHRTAL